MSTDEDPLSIFLVISGSRGTRMLFRYPFQNRTTNQKDVSYHTRPAEDVLYQNPYQAKDNCGKAWETLNNNNNSMFFNVYDDGALASMMAPKPVLCDQKFELKIGQVKFIGNPVQVITLILQSIEITFLNTHW